MESFLLLVGIGLILHAFSISADMKNIKRELNNLENKLVNKASQRTEITKSDREPTEEESPATEQLYSIDTIQASSDTSTSTVNSSPIEKEDIPTIKEEVMEKKTEEHEDLETKLGSNYLSKIGIAGIIAGMGFFLKYSFDNGWIGPIWQIMIGVAVGTFLLVLGEYFDKQYSKWAKSFTGGGLPYYILASLQLIIFIS